VHFVRRLGLHAYTREAHYGAENDQSPLDKSLQRDVQFHVGIRREIPQTPGFDDHHQRKAASVNGNFKREGAQKGKRSRKAIFRTRHMTE
jgi:hypothetical protein